MFGYLIQIVSAGDLGLGSGLSSDTEQDAGRHKSPEQNGIRSVSQ